MKKVVLLVLAALVSTTGLAYAQNGELSGSFEVIYLSKWLSKGGAVYGQQGGVFEALDLNLWDTGFGTYAIHRSATGAGNTNKERYDYGVYYKNKLFQGQSYVTDYKLRWAYEHYPNIARHKFKTTNEWKFSFSWPKLLDNGLVPQYAAYYEYPAGSGYANDDVTGWVHQFGFGYDMPVTEILPHMPEQNIHLSADISYRDGIGGKAKDSDWSHATFGASTKLKITEDISLIPAVFYQLSMDDSVSTRDHLYSTLCMRYQF